MKRNSQIGYHDARFSIFKFAISSGTFGGMNYFICQNKIFLIANEIFSKSKILLKQEVSNIG